MKSFVTIDFLPASPAPGPAGDPAEQRLGQDLRSMFDNLTSGPMPDRLLQLADALEEAFQRGDLFEPDERLDS